jgi:predicted nuclease of restriction endonuclease-like (RecB) superfamily
MTGDDFAFVGRQRRLRIDDAWYRVDHWTAHGKEQASECFRFVERH